MKSLYTVTLALAASLLMASPSTMAASLEDTYDPYVLSSDLDATPAGRTDRLADRFDPYVINTEIVTAKSCDDPEHEMIADRHDPFVTVAALNMAAKSKKC